MADKHHTVTVTKAEIDDANAVWLTFTQFTKYGIIAVVVVLGLMAVFLV